ncbi:MAG: glycosyltransferase family 1 protein [Fibrobacterota bacterium]
MRIAIDCRHVQYFNEGISRYTFNLLRLLKDDVEFHAILSDPRIIVPELESISGVTRHYIGPTWKKLDWYWENISLMRLLRNMRPDIYHAPCNTGLPIFRLQGIRYCVTFHDMLVKFYPEAYTLPARIKWHAGVRISARSAHQIIAVSEFTAELIRKYLRIPSASIRIVHHALNPAFQNQGGSQNALTVLRSKIGLKPDYIIYHGGFRSYKDVRRLIDVFDCYRNKYKPPLQLCLVGEKNKNWTKFVEPRAQMSLFRSDIIMPGRLTDCELAVLLGGASSFIYPSEMEGFGFAPLEAMACGTPVICAHNSSMSELLDNAVVWMEPSESPDRLVEKLDEINTNHAFAQCLTDRGYLVSAKFTESAFRNNMLEFYQDVYKTVTAECRK